MRSGNTLHSLSSDDAFKEAPQYSDPHRGQTIDPLAGPGWDDEPVLHSGRTGNPSAAVRIHGIGISICHPTEDQLALDDADPVVGMEVFQQQETTASVLPLRPWREA